MQPVPRLHAEIPAPPFPPHPPAIPLAPEVHVQPPLVFVAPAWEYRHLVRDLSTEGLPSDAELNVLGADGWELVSLLADGRNVHLYWKRQTR